MDKAIYHVNVQGIADFIDFMHPGIMSQVDLIKIAADREDLHSLILDFRYKVSQADGMDYITAIVVFSSEDEWMPVSLPLFEAMTAPSA